MDNVIYEVKGTKLIITCDISPAMIKKAPPSGTGRTLLVASSGGVVPVMGTSLRLAVNVMAKPVRE